MTTRVSLAALNHPFRWLAQPACWAALAAVALWVRSRTRRRLDVSPVSVDWLADNRRRSTRTRDL